MPAAAQDPRDAAFAARAEDRIGTLMPGMAADFLLLGPDGKPSEVWIDGISAWSAKNRK